MKVTSVRNIKTKNEGPGNNYKSKRICIVTLPTKRTTFIVVIALFCFVFLQGGGVMSCSKLGGSIRVKTQQASRRGLRNVKLTTVFHVSSLFYDLFELSPLMQ